MSSSRDVATGAAHLDGLRGHILAAPRTWAGVRTWVPAPGVRAVVVVVLEITGEIGAQGREAGHQGPRERGPVALLQDGLMDALHAAIALGPTGADARGADAGVGKRLGEGSAGELAGVVGADALEVPAVAGQVRCSLLGEGRGMARGGVSRGVAERGPGVAGGDIEGGVLLAAPAGAGQLADVETIQLH